MLCCIWSISDVQRCRLCLFSWAVQFLDLQKEVPRIVALELNLNPDSSSGNTSTGIKVFRRFLVPGKISYSWNRPICLVKLLILRSWWGFVVSRITNNADQARLKQLGLITNMSLCHRDISHEFRLGLDLIVLFLSTPLYCFMSFVASVSQTPFGLWVNCCQNSFSVKPLLFHMKSMSSDLIKWNIFESTCGLSDVESSNLHH